MNPQQPSQPAEFLDLYKAGLKSAVEVMKASLENAERLQQQQLSAIRHALEQHAKSVDELGNARSLEDLVALQQKMAGAQLERVVGYWSNVCQAAGRNQTEALGQVQQQMAQARDWFNDTYALTTRATEEAASIAAAKAAPREAPKEPKETKEATRESNTVQQPGPKRGSQGASMHR
jgi:phasin family protein